MNEKRVIELYKKGLSSRKIARIYHCPSGNIQYVLYKNSVKMRGLSESIRRYEADFGMFKKIDSPNKAYWLGFLYADGCVKNNSLILQISTKDEGHVRKFKRFMRTQAPILPKPKKCCGISINNKELIRDLKKHGLTERKTFTISTPVLPEEMLRHFYRGYLDGDGWITYRIQRNLGGKPSSTQHRSFDFGIACGSIDFILEFKEYISSIVGKDCGSFHKRKGKRHYQLSFGGNKIFAIATRVLYKGKITCMERKRASVNEYIREIGTYKWGKLYKGKS